MTTISLYTFEDRNGREVTYTTFDAIKAKDTAQANGWLCFDNEYKYSDRAIAFDFTGNFINWAACELGYVVRVFKAGELIHEYKAGNDPLCSDSYLEAHRGSGERKLKEYAKRSADALAKEHHVRADQVEEDEDLDEELRVGLGLKTER